MASFPDVPLFDDFTRCVKCGLDLASGQRVTQIWAVTGVGRQPKGDRRVPYVMDRPEFGHVACHDVNLRRASSNLVEIPRQKLKVDVDASLRPRFNEYTCAHCRKQVVRGDRILMAAIVQGIEKDPETGFPSAKCTGEFEVVHASCDDPQLKDGPGALILASK